MKKKAAWLLRVPEAIDEKPLVYAAQVLANSWSGEVAVERGQESDSGLAAPNGDIVTLAELDQVFKRVALLHEPVKQPDGGSGLRATELHSIGQTTGPVIEYLRAELRDPLSAMGGHGGDRLSVLITHDIDRVTCREPTFIVRNLLGQFGVIKRPWFGEKGSFRPQFLLNGLERLLRFEVDIGVSGLYFFLASGYDLGRYGARYSLRWNVARRALRLVREAAMEIGLHGSYNAGKRCGYREERHRLEDAAGVEVRAHRNHYLRFDPTTFWRELGRAGIAYDLSVGYRSRMGFRAGLASPYPGYDSVSHRLTSVWEIPLVFMDHPQYLIDPDGTLRQLRRVLENARRFGGYVSINFHPENMVLQPRMWDLYRRTIELCLELDCDLTGRLPERTEVKGARAS